MPTHTTTLHINSGTCKCGHSWDEHHLSVICNKTAWDAIQKYVEENFPGRRWKDSFSCEMTYPMYIPGECEHYGFNEYGGMKNVPSEFPDDEYGDDWEDHCHSYQDVDGPLGTLEIAYP